MFPLYRSQLHRRLASDDTPDRLDLHHKKLGLENPKYVQVPSLRLTIREAPRGTWITATLLEDEYFPTSFISSARYVDACIVILGVSWIFLERVLIFTVKKSHILTSIAVAGMSPVSSHLKFLNSCGLEVR